MNGSWASMFLLFFALLGCHADHHVSSKNKYKQMEAKSQTKVEVKEIDDKDSYVNWDKDSGESFLVQKVWTESKEQSCKECHLNSSLESIKGKVHPRSHWNISLKHASPEIMNCQTCHDNVAVWKFKVMQASVHANQSAQTCAQCHFKQLEDWENGAHGKRAVGWQYERAIFNCTSCHNPHNPSFEKRWPKVAPYRPKNNEERQ